MNYYTNKQLLNFWENKFHFLTIDKKDEVFYLTLDRANKKMLYIHKCRMRLHFVLTIFLKITK